MVSQSELLSHADGVEEGLMLSSSSILYNVRARGGVLAGRSKRAGGRNRYMSTWVELY